MKHVIRYMIWVLAFLLVAIPILFILFYIEEDWRGARDWAACQRDLAAKGETLDLRQLIPPGNPADDLSKVPIFAPLFEKDNDSADLSIKKLDIGLGEKSSMLPKLGGFQVNHPVDLEAWQKFYRSLPQAGLSPSPQTPARDILQALSVFDSSMAQIDTAMSNPNAYWPTNYTPPFLTEFSCVTHTIAFAKILQLRAIAHLENHETDLAEKDYLFSFHLHQPLAKRCFFIDYLVMIGVRAIDESILWEGLRRHAWSDAQLHQMESTLGANDILAFAQQAIRTDRAESLDTMKYVQKGHYDQLVTMSKEDNLKSAFGEFEMLVFLHVRPSGWGKQELAYLSNKMQNGIDSIDHSRGTLDSDFYKNLTDSKTWPAWKKVNFLMPAILLVPLDKLGVNVARAETYRRLARLACRLEEYRIAHRAYPDKLDDLPDLPAHLNQEVLSQQPLQYHRQGDGYQLYSLGWNQKDDGGTYNADPQQGDWPWPSP